MSGLVSQDWHHQRCQSPRKELPRDGDGKEQELGQAPLSRLPVTLDDLISSRVGLNR